jgi:hypothetical protein
MVGRLPNIVTDLTVCGSADRPHVPALPRQPACVGRLQQKGAPEDGRLALRPLSHILPRARDPRPHYHERPDVPSTATGRADEPADLEFRSFIGSGTRTKVK